MFLDTCASLLVLVPYSYLPLFHHFVQPKLICLLVEGLLFTEGHLLFQCTPKDYQNKSVCEGHSIFCEGKHPFSWLFLVLYCLNSFKVSVAFPEQSCPSSFLEAAF